MNETLVKALKELFINVDFNLLEDLSMVLDYIIINGEISQAKLSNLVEYEHMDFMLFIFENKLLFPQNSFHMTLEWDDCSFLLDSNQILKPPKIIKYLIREVLESGFWDLEIAILNAFRDIKEPEYKKMFEFIKLLYKNSEEDIIKGLEIKELCNNLDLEKSVNRIIAELKSLDLISPRLVRSLFKSAKAKSPHYELHPFLKLLFENKRRE